MIFGIVVSSMKTLEKYFQSLQLRRLRGYAAVQFPQAGSGGAGIGGRDGGEVGGGVKTMVIDLSKYQGLQQYSMTPLMRETPIGLMQWGAICVEYDGMKWVQVEPLSEFFMESSSGDIARLVFGPVGKG